MSIGIAVATESTTSAEEVLREADLAMYEAKPTGGEARQPSPLKRGPRPGSKPPSLKLRRKMAGWNTAYLQTILTAQTR